jgi:eukaryotic-like serine/threonine-protein kinase
MTMRRFILFFSIVAGSSLWGFGLGALSGAMSSVFPSVFTLFFAVIGALLGLLVGVTGGTVIGVITPIFFYPTPDKSLYRFTIICIGIVLAFSATYLTAVAVATHYSVTGETNPLAGILPAALASVAAGYATNRGANWYFNWLGD